MDVKFKYIASILEEWNPLSVDLPIVQDEYIGYVAKFVRVIDENGDLYKCLMEFLIYLGIDVEEIQNNKEIENIIRKMMDVKNLEG
jgi:hypothetical protein